MTDLINKKVNLKRTADKVSYNRVSGSTLNSDAGNDIIGIDFFDNSAVTLGNGNDIISISSFERTSTINGGAGRDLLKLSYASSELKWTWNTTDKTWTVTSAKPGQNSIKLRNIENVAFNDGTLAQLSGNAITISGSNNNDAITLISDGIGRFASFGGNGNDVFTVSGTFDSTSPPITVNGGNGSDKLILSLDPNSYLIAQENGRWSVSAFFNSLPFQVIELVDIETIAFSDGSTLALEKSGGKFTAGNNAVSFVGTNENDTMIGSAKSDVFVGLAGNDFFDLSRGGQDTVDFSGMYAVGTIGNAEVTVKGAGRDDKFEYTFYNMSSDQTSIVDNVRVGKVYLTGLLSPDLTITFQK